MSSADLVNHVIEAHGGQNRWEAVAEIVIEARVGGMALPARLQFRALRHFTARVLTERPSTFINPYPRDPLHGNFERNGVQIIAADDEILQARQAPRAYFQQFRRKLLWDDLDTLYFAGYAFWNYLMTPFLFLMPGFQLTELASWQEQGEVWRRLHVVFPEDIPTHCREQIFYYDQTGLLRRHDYTAEIFGSWVKAAHYCFAHRDYSGLLFPTRRRVKPRWRERALPFPTLVSIDIDNVTVIDK